MFDIITKIFNIAFWSVWKRCFSPAVLKVFSQNRNPAQPYASANFEVWQDICTVTFPFGGYYFKSCCCKTNVYNYRRYQSLTWKCSNFFKWAAFGKISTEAIIFICAFVWNLSLVIFITLSWKSHKLYFVLYVCLIFHAEFDYLWVFKSWFFIFVDYQKMRWGC